MNYGITPSGFVRMRLPEIRQEIVTTLNAKASARAGRAVTVETSRNSITGIFIDTTAEREAALWEHMESQYYAMYPHTAEGVNQDNAVAFTGVERLGDTKSTTYALFSAANGTTIQAGTQVNQGSNLFELVEDITVSQNVAGAFRVELAVITPSTDYTITVNGSSHTYTTLESGVNASSVLNSLLTFLQSLGLNAVIASAGVDVVVDGRNSVSVGVSPTLLLASIESVGFIQAVNAGPIEVPENSLTGVVTNNTNVYGVRNYIEGNTGTLREEDPDLALRYTDGPFRLGSGTLPAIRANLRQNVPGVTDLRVVQNTLAVADNEGRPSGAIEVIVRGGDSTALRNEIYRVKAAGTPAFGLSTANVYDEEGEPHVIGFTRASPVYVWAAVRVVLKEGATVGAATFQQIQTIIVAQGNNYRIGEDVIRQEFIGPIYELTDAVAEVELTLYASRQVNYVPTLNEYASENLDIGLREYASFGAGRVTVF